MHFAIYSKYYYSKLTEQEKSLYCKIRDGWLEYRSKVLIMGNYSSHSFERVFEAIHEDVPELFYVDFSRVSITGMPLAMTVNCHFLYGKSESEKIKAQIYESLKKVVASAAQTKDKIETAHNYLVSNVKYAFSVNSNDSYSIVGGLLKHEAVCEGYARSFKLLCDTLNVPCIIVSGTAINQQNSAPERHAWNIVRYNDANYHIDVTWNTPAFQSNSSMPYYLVSDKYMRRDHKWKENKWPRCETEGEYELKTVRVTGPSMLVETLKQAISKRMQDVHIVFNKVFSSDSEISRLIAESMTKLSPRNVAQYSCRFGSSYDSVTVGFEYR